MVNLRLASPELSSKTSRKVTAQITADGQIYILDGELNAGANSPLGGGTAKIQGKRIELEFNSTPLLATDAKGLPIANTVSNKIVLTRK